MTVKKGRSELLPVTSSKQVIWDRVTWTVRDKSDTELLKSNCSTSCAEMFSFKVDVGGVHGYSVEMEKDGEKFRCESDLFVVGRFQVSTFHAFIRLTSKF